MVSRRDLVRGLGLLGLAGTLPKVFAAARAPDPSAPSRFRFEAPPFGLGVASGDPTPRSVVIWTRLAPRPLDPAGHGGLAETHVPVTWAVATDPQMRNVVRRGLTAAAERVGYAVHVDVTGLEPDTHYYYRFATGSRSSRIGRTRTAAEAPQALRFACVACQDFNALYGAYENLAREPLDFIVHLGDTIYDTALGVAATDLAGYRNKHALFRGDPKARDAWAAHPFIVTWDDHEVRDNYCGTDPQYDTARAAGYQAFYENMPVRLPEGIPAAWQDLRVYRHARFGDLLELDMLDLRQYRAPRATDQAEALRAGRSLLGQGQKQWLRDRLPAAAAWTCLGSSVTMGGYTGNLDAWEGYAHERWELLRLIGERGRGRVVVMSGDRHHAVVSRLLAGIGPRFASDDRAVAVEFGVPALSSKAPGPERADPDAGFAVKPGAPWLLYRDDGYHGYVVCEVTDATWQTTYRVLRNGASSCMTTLASFQVRPGEQGPQVTSAGFVPFPC